MLTAITLGNFMSYKTARLPLASLTVLVGANASGKSNAIEAMQLLACLAQGEQLRSLRCPPEGPDQAASRRIEDLGHAGAPCFSIGCESDAEWSVLSMEITRQEDGLHIRSESLSRPNFPDALYRLEEPSADHGTEVLVTYNSFAPESRTCVRCSDQRALFVQMTNPAVFGTHARSREVIPSVAGDYVRWLSAMLFLCPVPARMRSYSMPAGRLRADAANLSGVLFSLWGAEASAQQEPFITHREVILGFVRDLLERAIAGLSFRREPRGGVMVQLTEVFSDRRQPCDASLLSAGTLRVLAIAAAMLCAEEGSVVVLEEMDSIHPSRARELLARIRDLAQRRRLRVLLLTHSPALLDALPEPAVDDVVICYRDGVEGDSRLIRIGDFPGRPILLTQGTPGQLMGSGLLDWFAKSCSAEERIARGLACVQSLLEQVPREDPLEEWQDTSR